MKPASSHAMTGPRVLIADDQSAFRELLRQMLVGVAREIVECADGVEAVAAFETHQPDWALLDWVMPNLDGQAAARAIRARHPRARIVILSSHLTPMLASEAQAAGACGCFPKERMHEVIALLRASLSDLTSTNAQTSQPSTRS